MGSAAAHKAAAAAVVDSSKAVSYTGKGTMKKRKKYIYRLLHIIGSS